MDTLGQKIKSLRMQINMTQVELADKLGKERSTISSWETNRREPDGETLKDLAKLFSVTVDYLLGNQPSPTPDLPEIPEGLPFKPTSRDKKQWKDLLEKGGQAFFYNDEIDEEDKKEMLDLLTEFFIDAKVKNKVKYGRKKKKESELTEDGGNA